MSGGLSFDVQVDREKIADAISWFEFLGMNSEDALRVALNKTAPKMKTAASREIRKQVRLKAAYVGERLTVRRATRARLSAAISTPSRGMLLSRFSTDAQVASDGTKWTSPPKVPAGGIRVQVKATGGSKVVLGPRETRPNKPFYIVLKNGYVAIAARVAVQGPKQRTTRNAKGMGSKKRTDNKYQIFRGPSLSQVFNTVRQDVMPDAGAELTRQMLDAMRYLLVKQYPSEGGAV